MKNIIFAFVIIFMGCSSTKQINNEGVKASKEIIDVTVIESDNKILFKIVNNSEGIVYIYDPQNINIERFEDGSWVKLRILKCPCGAPCAKPDDKIEIFKDKYYELSWDKNESWCGKRNEAGFQDTKKQIAKAGNYRIRIIHSISNNKKDVFYKKFILN